MDAFYGLIGRELGVHIVYQDDLVATHVVRKSRNTVANIGYRSGVSTAKLSRDRGFAEKDHSNGQSETIQAALLAARAEG